MRASPFQTHSLEGSTVGYDRVRMLSAGGGDLTSLRSIACCYPGIDSFTCTPTCDIKSRHELIRGSFVGENSTGPKNLFYVPMDELLRAKDDLLSVGGQSFNSIFADRIKVAIVAS